MSSSSDRDEIEIGKYHNESDRDEIEIDKYYNESNSSASSSESGSSSENSSESSSSESNSTDEQYLSRVPSPSEEVDIIYSCAMNIPSRVDEKGLFMLRDKYQIPDKVNPCLATLGEWSCTPNSLGVGIYEAYLLGGLRLPLNAFAREFLHRLEIGPNQLNPNAWRTLMFMQVL